MQLSKYKLRFLKSILFITLFFLFTIIMDVVFEYDENVTESMLSSYSHTKNIDTVFIGNSVGEMINDDLYSELYGKQAFNMCTPSQSLSISLENIKLAASHNDIKKAVLLISLDSISAFDYDAMDHLYNRVIESSRPLPARIIDKLTRDFSVSLSPDVINTEESVNVFFPWLNETSHGFDNICENIKKRSLRFIRKEPLGNNIAFDLRIAKYIRNPGNLNEFERSLLEEDKRHAGLLDIPDGMITDESLSDLANMCVFCRENNINFKVIVTPHRTDYFERYADFRDYSITINNYLNNFITKRGYQYYDTESDPNLHNILTDDCFYDQEHISNNYFDKATEYLYKILETDLTLM